MRARRTVFTYAERADIYIDIVVNDENILARHFEISGYLADTLAA